MLRAYNAWGALVTAIRRDVGFVLTRASGLLTTLTTSPSPHPRTADTFL